MAQPYERVLAEGFAPRQGIQRRAVDWAAAPSEDVRSDPEKEVQATIARTGAVLPTLQGVSRSLFFDDQAGASEAYARARAAEERAAELDSDVDANLLNASSVGEFGAGLRKLAIQSSPSLVAALGGGVAGGAAAGRVARGVERRAAARAMDDGFVAPASRVQATSPAAMAMQRQEALQKAAGRRVAGDADATARIDRASRAGTFAGATAAGAPVLLPDSLEYLEGADRGDTAKLLAANVGAAALGSIPAERLLGRIFRTPAAQAGVGQALLQAPKRVLKEMGAQAGWEGATEAGQAFIQRAGHKWVDENVELFSPEALQEYALNAIGGAALGGALGGSVEVGRVAPQAVRDAGRWAWDQTGETRAKVRDYIEKTAARTQGAVDAGFARMDAATGGPEGRRAAAEQAKGDAADLFRRAREAASGATNAASAAGKRFWQTHVKRQRQDDVDALTDEVMQTYEEVFSGRESGRRIAQAAARAKDLTTKYALSFVDADYLDGMHPDDADYIGRILGKIAVGTELAAPEAKELARVFDDPASGLTEKALVRIGVDGPGVAKWVRSMARPLSTTAGIEQEAPVMARGRDAAAELAATTGVQSLDESGASDATTSDAEAEAAERGADQTEDVLRDFNNGINERATAGERLAPVDRLNSIRQSMRAIEARTKDNERLSEEDRAHARAEYVTLRTEARQLRDDLRSKIEAKNGVITRNDSSAKASQFFASRQRNPGYVALRNTVEVTTKAGETKQQPQMLDLGMLIMRQQAAMRAEGSTDENIDAKAALLRGLTEAADAGLEVDYNAFKVGSIVNSQTGREILKITPRLRKQLRGAVLPEWSPWGGEMGSPEAEAIRNDPDVAAAARHELTRLELKKSPSKKDQARAADLEAMLARAPEERTQSRVVEGRETANVDPIDHGDYASDLRRQGARAVPPGVQDQGTEQGQRRRRKDGRGFEPTTKADTDVRKDEFIPQEGVVADVRFNSPHEQQLRTWMKERSPADPDNPGRRLVLTPAQRAAIDRKYGELIGAAALAAEAEAGTISPKRLENELKRLTDPKSGLAKRYLERAYKGELPGGETVASVRHTPTDAEKRATGKHADRADGDGHPDNDATADRIDRTTEALRDSGEGNRPATRPIKRSKPVPKPAPKKRVVKKRELTTPEEAVNAHAKTLAELKPRLVTDRAREAADILTGGTFKLEDGSAVAIPEATLQRAVAMARRIADGWSTFPENGGFAAQSDWMRGEGRDVPQPAELYDLVNEAYQAAEAVKRYGPPSPLKAAEAAGKVFAPAALADWAAKRSVVDDVTSMEDLCLATSEHTVWVLRAHGYRAARAHASVTIPGSTDGRQMGHYAAVVEIDGQRFIVDQPQGELFAPTGDGNMVKIKQRAFTPRFIPASEAAAAYDTPGVEFHMPANVELSTLPVADFAAVPEAPKAPKAKPGTNRISADLRARAAKADDDTLRQMVSQVEARIRGGDASEAALDAMRDDRAHLLGLLSQRAEAANAAAVESLTTSTEHDVKAESKLVRAWLKLLGIKHPLVVEDLTKHMIGGDRAAAEAGLTSGRLGGQHAIGRGQKADKARIRLNPHLHGAERVSVLAHEVGHHVVFHELAKALKRPFTDVVRMSDADLLAAMREHRPDIAADYDAWLAKRGGASTVPVQQSSSPIDRVLGHEARGAAVGRVTSFNEWLADNVAKALLGKRETQSVVGKFFKGVAEALQKTYDMIFRSGAFKQYRPAKSVEAWINDLFDANAAAVKAATGASTDAKGGRASVKASAAAAAMRSAANTPPPGAPPAAPADVLPPDGSTSLRSMMRFVRNVIPAEERRILDRATNTPNVRRVIEQIISGSPDEALLRKMLNSTRLGVEARISLAYFAHLGGSLKVGPKGESAFVVVDMHAQAVLNEALGTNAAPRMRPGEAMFSALGIATENRLAERVFNDIASGILQRQGKDYNVRKREGMIRGKRQQVLNSAVQRWETLSNAIGIALDGKARRMLESSVPALRRIAGQLQKPTGAFDDDRGMIPAMRDATARFGNRVNKAYAGLTQTQTLRAMRFMQRGDTDLSQLKPDVRRAVVQTRALMDELYDYMKAAGVEVGKRENFFPVLFNSAQVGFEQKLTKLLSDPDYEQPIREFLEAAQASRGKDVKGAKKEARQPKRVVPPIKPEVEEFFAKQRAKADSAQAAATNESIIDAFRKGNVAAIEKHIVAAEQRRQKYENQNRNVLVRLIELEIRYARARIKEVNEAPIDEAATAQAEAAAPATAPIADLIQQMVRGATGEPGEIEATDGAPNFRGMNFRSMEFIDRLYRDALAGDKRTKGVKERVARHRKNVEAFARLQARDPADVIARYVVPLVKNAEHTRRFGKDGVRLEKLLADAKRQGATDSQVNEARNAVLASVGAYGLDESPTLRAISPALAERFSGPKTKAFVHGMQAYQNLRLLPLALISSLVEPVGMAVRSGGDAKVAWEGFKTGVRSLYDKATREELRAALDALGATDDMFAEVALHQDNTKFTHKVNTLLFKWNGLTAWTRATRFMALTAAHGFLLKHNGGAANEHSARYLAELGLRPGDVVQGEPGRVALQTGNAKRDERVRNALMQFVDEAIIRPNSQQTPMWVSDPYMGLFAQYKAFAYAMYDQIPGRVMHEISQGNAAKPIAAALAYLPVIMMAELLRELIQNLGEDERRKDWGFDEYAWLAITRSGMINPRTEAGLSTVEDVQRRNLPGTSALGPTGQQARDVYRAFTGRRSLGEEAQRALPLAAAHRRWDEALAGRGRDSDRP